MTSVYDLMRQRCGMSQADAAEFHDVRIDTIKSWCSDRRPAPDSAIDELRDLYDKITAAGLAHAAEIKRRRPQMNEEGKGVYYVGEPLHDNDARAHGWPNIAACMAAIAVAIAALPRPYAIKLVPRVQGAIQIPYVPKPSPGDVPDPAPGGFQSVVNSQPRRPARRPE